MKFDWSAPNPLSYFAALVQDDAQLPLLEAAISLGQDEDPALDVQQVLLDVDHLAQRLRRRLPDRADVLQRIQGLNRFFFGELGFGGNRNDYYAADNSYIHRVLRTRLGIPVSLAVLWLELAHAVELPAEGIGFPAHFLVQVRVGEGRIVIDPFTGQGLRLDDLRERLDELSLGGVLPLPPQPGPLPLSLFLEPATPRQILARMLGNLQQLHRSHSDWQRLLAVQERLVTLLPQAWAEYRNRGLALAELGQHDRARADLRLYLQHSPSAPDRQAIEERLAVL